MRLIIVCLLVLCATAAKESTHVVDIATGNVYRFTVDNSYLLDWRYLWSSRVVVIEQFSDSPFEVYYSTSSYGMDNMFSLDHQDSKSVTMAPCSRSSQNTMEKCVFFLSAYGENTNWWFPRLEYLFEAQPPTHVAVRVPDTSLFGNNETKSFRISLLLHSHLNSSPIMFVLGIILFLCAKYLCRSLNFYLSLWFIAGALLSIGTLIIVAIYIGLSFSPKLASISGMVALTIGAAYGLFNYDYVLEFFLHPAQHKVWLAIILLGGIAGLMVGYTPELSSIQSSQVFLCSRIFAVALIFFSFTQFELGVVLSVFIVLFLLCFEVFVLKRVHTNRRKRRTAMGDQITLEEYAEEGAELTAEAIDDLIQQYEDDPEALHKLSSRGQRRTITLIQRRKREMRRDAK